MNASAFCLIEAPNINAVKDMHKHAHGLIPHNIIEVENKVVEAFLGRILKLIHKIQNYMVKLL